MAVPNSGDPGNPLQSLLGDLMNMLGSNGPDHWEMTKAFALNVATGGSPELNIEPLARIQVEQLARVAELNVIEATGMPVHPDGRRLTCVPVGRGDWTLRALESWRPILTAMTASTPGGPEADNDLSVADPELEDDPTGGMAAMFGKWASAVGPMMVGLQAGSVVGHLSHRALGQYPLALPWAPSDELLLVTANIADFASDWSLPAEEALLWVCVRELASNSVLTRPSVRSRLEELLLDLASSQADAQQDVAGRLRGLTGGDPSGLGTGMDLESLQGMFGDPEELLGDLLTPETRRTSDRLTALAVVVDAYADHIAATIGPTLVGAHAQLAEAWYRRRTERGKGETAAGSLFGLELDATHVDRGRAFVSGVVERAGEESLRRLWNPASNLPTPAEVDAPGLWLERIDLPLPETETESGPSADG